MTTLEAIIAELQRQAEATRDGRKVDDMLHVEVSAYNPTTFQKEEGRSYGWIFGDVDLDALASAIDANRTSENSSC